MQVMESDHDQVQQCEILSCRENSRTLQMHVFLIYFHDWEIDKYRLLQIYVCDITIWCLVRQQNLQQPETFFTWFDSLMRSVGPVCKPLMWCCWNAYIFLLSLLQERYYLNRWTPSDLFHNDEIFVSNMTWSSMTHSCLSVNMSCTSHEICLCCLKSQLYFSVCFDFIRFFCETVLGE